jgi:hypothetical protein
MQRVAKRIRPVVRRFSAVFEEEADDVEMSFAYGEVNWRRVIVLAADQFGAMGNKRFHPVEIAVARGAQHVPDVIVVEVAGSKHFVLLHIIEMPAGIDPRAIVKDERFRGPPELTFRLPPSLGLADVVRISGGRIRKPGFRSSEIPAAQACLRSRPALRALENSLAIAPVAGPRFDGQQLIP